MHRKPLVSWNWAWGWYNSGRVRDPVKPLVLIKDRDRSVSVICACPLRYLNSNSYWSDQASTPGGTHSLASSHYKQELF